MAYTDFLTAVNPGDNDFQKWAKLQAQVRACVVVAGITIPNVSTNPLLDNIHTGDNDYQKFAKTQAWLQLLASNPSPAAADSQASVLALTTGVTSQAVVFATPFAVAPAVTCSLIAPNGGAVIACNPENVTVNGFTAVWGGFAIPAGYSLSWQAVPKTQ
jgi:hypothetical protein